MADTPQAAPQPQESQTPLFDMSKATPIQAPAAKPLFDMSKATPISSASQDTPPISNYDPAVGMFSSNSILVDAAKGIGKGVLDTTSGIGEIIHKIPVVGPALIPREGLNAEERISGANTIGEGIGKGIENIAEFATGDELLEGITRVAKLEQLAKSSPIIAKMIEKTPELFKKIATGATKGAAVGGAQGAVKGAAEGDAVGGAEGGAAGGAIGGGVIGAIEGSAPTVKEGVKKATGLGTSAEEDITRALQPAKRNDKFLENWDISKERYAKELDAEGKYADFNDAAERMRGLRQDLWQNEVKPKIDAHSTENMFANTGPANPVATAIRARITPAMQKVSPNSAKAIETVAKRFEGSMTVGEAEEIAEHLNAELTNAGYWKASASERAALDKANPKVSSASAAVESIRDSLAEYLESVGETDVKELKRTYGAMRSVENDVRGRINVAGRQQPLSLKQIIALASGHPLGIAATLMDKIYNNPTALLNRAMKKTLPDTTTQAGAKKVVNAAVSTTKEAAPALGAEGIRELKKPSGGGKISFVASDGRKYQVPGSAWEKVLKADPGAQLAQ